MSNHRCYAVDCGRVMGVDRPYTLCDYHRADLDAGVEVTLSTGWTFYRDPFGTLHARKPRKHGIIGAIETNGEALRQQPSPWSHDSGGRMT